MKINILLLIGFLLLVRIHWMGDFESGEEIRRTWTTAICEENICRDFEVKCLGNEVLEMRPVTGFVVFGEGWVDRRENKRLC
jgi:hypothetical protein